MTQSDFLLNAINYRDADISIIPTKIIEKSPDVIAWKNFQSEIASKELVVKWFSNNDKGLAIVCGPGSGNMELLDFDNHLNNAESIYNDFTSIVRDKAPDLFSKLVIQSTQNKGYHILYRCGKIENNQKLAKQKDSKGNLQTVIETRGSGGYALAFPTKGYTLIQNTIDKVQLITIEEREFLINLCRSFNEIEPEPEQKEIIKQSDPSNLRAGDDYNGRGDIKDILISYGWSFLYSTNEKHFWCRPGKKLGVSATWNFNNNGKFYVFSSNAHPFNSETSYDKFSVYTHLVHNGDYSASARDLLSKGYGSVSQKRDEQKPKAKAIQVEEGLSIFEEIINELDFSHTKVIPRSVVFKIIEKLFEWQYNEVTLDCMAKPIKANWDLLSLAEDDRIYWRESVFTNNWHEVNDRFGLAMDDFIAQFYSEFKGKDFTCKNECVSLFYRPDVNRSIHPIEDYFNGLPDYKQINNAVDPISEWFDLLKINNDYSLHKTKLKNLFTKWLIMVMQCAMGDRANDVMLLLVGGQNTGKTTAIRSLFPNELKDYIKDNFSDEGRDTKIALAQNLFFFDDEGTSLEGANVKFLKGLLSQRTVKTRRPYGTKDEVFKRICSFVGTENNDDFLKDETGSRRFLIIPVDAIEEQEIIDDVLHKIQNFDNTHLWSYVKSLYKNRTSNVEFSKDDIEFTHNLNKNFSSMDEFDDLIIENFLNADITTSQNGTHYSATKVLDLLIKKTSIPIANKSYAIKNMGRALIRCGFKKTSNNGTKGYWISTRG